MGDVIEPGMDGRHVIARVERERQALALMDRPNIARVRDAGPTSARLPCFVMDLVDGVRITRYCDSRKPGLNRDIKPSNELV
jgi:serine/threonine protein kinase